VSGGPLETARRALAGTEAWVVGGAIRDRLLGRPPGRVEDLDLAVSGDPAAAARALGREAPGAVFALSEEFGAWRVVDRGGAWRIDLAPLQGTTIEDDLARRDFTVNAIAEPLAGDELIDPTGGRADLAARRLRAVSDAAFDEDPLRTLRLVRLACELELEPEGDTVAAARERAARMAEISAERVFAELKAIVCAPAVLRGLALLDEVGLTPFVLPELAALRGVEQSRYHHLDVHDHTLAVLEQVLALERDPGSVLGEHAAAVLALLAEPLGDELTRGQALRFGALLHDAAKPQTRRVLAPGRVGFPGHDAAGADLARTALTRLRAGERLCAHVAALTRNHLRLGFLVHERPLSRRAVYRYLRACEPVEVDVTVLSVADRLATRGRKADEAIARHLDLARELLGEALAWRAGARSAPLVRGDELASALDVRPGPRLGELLAELEEARFAGEISTREEAVARARALLAS
jgi:tRNA nucleotidyltransferase/poly(A) polymerase